MNAHFGWVRILLASRRMFDASGRPMLTGPVCDRRPGAEAAPEAPRTAG